MARLSDYGIEVDQLENSDVVTIRGHEFPIVFTMETMEYIADVYGDDYEEFEKAMNQMLKESDGQIVSSDLTAAHFKIMRALIYGMLRTGGLDESPDTIYKFLGMGNDVLTVYGACMQIFARQTFQVEDLKKSKEPQDHQRKIQNINKKKRKNKRR